MNKTFYIDKDNIDFKKHIKFYTDYFGPFDYYIEDFLSFLEKQHGDYINYILSSDDSKKTLLMPYLDSDPIVEIPSDKKLNKEIKLL